MIELAAANNKYGGYSGYQYDSSTGEGDESLVSASRVLM